MSALTLSRPKPRAVQGYVAGERRRIHLLTVEPGRELRADAAIYYVLMRAAAAAAGVQLQLNSAFRAMEEQRELYQRYLNGTGNLAAKPGFSNHQGGIAVDIATGGTTSRAYAWLAGNAERFGFVRTVPSEPWHWEFRPGEKGVST
ncbi:MAG TPA: M15 family metallopeptidase [Myxococcaceae bacterium]|nr:M15 family metallopeptidase [Myxococcaceae bacterium]